MMFRSIKPIYQFKHLDFTIELLMDTTILFFIRCHEYLHTQAIDIFHSLSFRLNLVFVRKFQKVS